MSLERRKPYKAKDPFKTINEIRYILEQNKIFTIEHHSLDTNLPFFDCRITLDDELINNFNLGTNGKGISRQYALASAYGEFMERVQNMFLFDYTKFACNSYIKRLPPDSTYRELLEKLDVNLYFTYFSDEKFLSISDVIKDCKNYIIKLFKEESVKKITNYLNLVFRNKKLLCVPYFNVQSRKIQYLPTEILRYACGSNGMCAGNTKEEAIIQGICEIFERYVLKKIYTENITPPTVPLSYFYNTSIFDKIISLEKKYEYKIVIKDCSLGEELPVIGVLVIDTKRNKYAFNLGSDPSYITALERCLTEFYQGDINLKLKDLNINDEKTHKESIFEISAINNYYKLLTNNTGNWPICILKNQESYKFSGFTYTTSKSDKDDLNHLTKIIFDLNLELFVRDVSILNFPSFHVYIPGMSESHIVTNDDLKNQIEYYENLPTLLNIKNSNNSEIEKLLELMVYSYKRSFPLKGKITKLFLYNENKDLNDIPIEIFIFMLSFKIKKYKQAHDFLEIYLKNTINKDNRSSLLYLLCIRDYLRFILKKAAHAEIIKSLKLIYGENLTNEVMNDFNTEDNILKNYSFPSCFNCEMCNVYYDCKYFHILKYVKKLQIRSEDMQISQKNLDDVFYSD